MVLTDIQIGETATVSSKWEIERNGVDEYAAINVDACRIYAFTSKDCPAIEKAKSLDDVAAFFDRMVKHSR